MAGEQTTPVDGPPRVIDVGDAITRPGRTRRTIRRLAVTASAVGYVPGVAAGTAWLVAAGLLSLAPVGPVTGITLTTDALPVMVADGPSTPVVGYVSAGTTRVYVPAPAVLAVIVGEVAAARRPIGGYLIAVGLGAASSASLVVLSGCGCGTGSTKYLYEAVVAVL